MPLIDEKERTRALTKMYERQFGISLSKQPARRSEEGCAPIAHTIEQGSVNWFKLRVGRVTASELGNLLTPEFKERTGQTPATYLFTKAAELWRGAPLYSAGSWATEQGQIREDIAIPWLALEKGWDIRPGGFIESADGKAGCSPDGLVGDDFGVEVKCPEPTKHVQYLLDGIIPKEYLCQVYGSLYVTGFPRWVFMSYHQDFPPLIIDVLPDKAILERIDKVVQRFSKDLAYAIERLKFIESNL